MAAMASASDVASGPGPRWFRHALVGVAAIYFIGLMSHRAPEHEWLRPIHFFVEATALFPNANVVTHEARLEAWQCDTKTWQPLDPRPYFKIEADDKESRLQRFEYFYRTERPALQALDAYVTAKHATGVDDGVAGKIGGIRLYTVEQPIPTPGDPPLHYEFDPFGPVPADERKDLFYTKGSERQARCSR
jgi:hypothetical protein